MMAQQPSQSPTTLQKDLSHRIMSNIEETEEDLNTNQQKVKESEQEQIKETNTIQLNSNERSVNSNMVSLTQLE